MTFIIGAIIALLFILFGSLFLINVYAKAFAKHSAKRN